MIINALTVYLKVFGLAVDEYGGPAYAGIKISLGALKRPMEYEEVVAKLDVKALLNYLPGMSEYAETAEIITPEEYFRDYADDEEQEDSHG